MCGPAKSYTPSFAFIDQETVGHVNQLNGTIETRKILRSDDGQIALEIRKILGIPVVGPSNYRVVEAVWSGDHPSIPVSSPVVRPDNCKRPSSTLPFQSSFGSSIVALSIIYITDSTSPPRPDMQSVGAIIPRAELLDPHAVWSMRSFLSVPLSLWTSITFAISGTRWINRRLDVFDFNKIRFQTVQARLRAVRESEASPSVGERTSPNAKVEHSFGSWRSLSLHCLTLSPLNRPVGDYHDVLADDERIVGLRYKVR
jgi:hypothetical protein